MMRLLVVTDIHGKPGSTDCLSRALSGQRQWIVHTVSLSELLGVDFLGERLHRHLIESDGFARAAARLVGLAGPTDVAIGYSAGGMVLWQSVQQGLAVDRLICISSTRLRQVSAHAMPRPALAVFGENDANRPVGRWGAGSGVQTHIIPHAEHDFYASGGSARDECLARVSDFLNCRMSS